jgi:phage shock protein A
MPTSNTKKGGRIPTKNNNNMVDKLEDPQEVVDPAVHPADEDDNQQVNRAETFRTTFRTGLSRAITTDEVDDLLEEYQAMLDTYEENNQLSTIEVGQLSNELLSYVRRTRRRINGQPTTGAGFYNMPNLMHIYASLRKK